MEHKDCIYFYFKIGETVFKLSSVNISQHSGLKGAASKILEILAVEQAVS